MDDQIIDGQRVMVQTAKDFPDRRGPKVSTVTRTDPARGMRTCMHALADPVAQPGSTGYRLTVENLSVDTSWQDLKDFARTGGKVSSRPCAELISVLQSYPRCRLRSAALTGALHGCTQ